LRDSREFPGIPEREFPVALQTLPTQHAYEMIPPISEKKCWRRLMLHRFFSSFH